MTKQLMKAFKEASELPEIEQNALAKWLLEEIQSDRKWSKAFSASEDVLGKLAEEALQDRKNGKVTALNPSRL
jgi:hypothetical protein